eukprot:scaffold27464_cov64-Phaeocystis_antarctica.AAC.4
MIKEARLALHLRTATPKCGHVSRHPRRVRRAATHLDHLAHLRIGERLQVKDGKGLLVLSAPDARRPARHHETEAARHERLEHKVLDELLEARGLVHAVDDDDEAAQRHGLLDLLEHELAPRVLLRELRLNVQPEQVVLTDRLPLLLRGAHVPRESLHEDEERHGREGPEVGGGGRPAREHGELVRELQRTPRLPRARTRTDQHGRRVDGAEAVAHAAREEAVGDVLGLPDAVPGLARGGQGGRGGRGGLARGGRGGRGGLACGGRGGRGGLACGGLARGGRDLRGGHRARGGQGEVDVQ